MSTRCQIGFYESPESPLEKPEALLYRHSDGYPSAVLPDIMPFLEWWSKGRGISDLEYCSARLLQYLCNQYDGHSLEFNSEMRNKMLFGHDTSKEDEDTKRFTGIYGHGICNSFHGDIEYYYAITEQGVVVFEDPHALYEEGQCKSFRAKKMGTVPFEGWEKSKDYKKLVKIS